MKRVLIVLLFIGAGVLGWYFLIRRGEFEVKFEIQTLPGSVVQTLRIWSRSLPESSILEVDSVYGVQQRITTEGRTYLYDWAITQVNDSTSRVKIRISESGKGFMNKLLVPISSPQIERDADRLGREFYQVIREHVQITRVRIVGKVHVEERFCVCTSLSTSQLDKAQGMMKDYGLLAAFIDDHKLTLKGKPLVDVRYWNHKEGQLKFDFCFPIEESDSLPQFGSLFYKTIARHEALKAVYFGNYITSDRAWYYLLNYAEKNGYTTDGLPKEVFYNNPNLGANESSWRAEIFLPVK